LVSKTNALIGMGLVLIFIGALWMLNDEAVDTVVDMFPFNTSGLILMEVGWNVWPIICLFFGMVCVLVAIGISGGGRKVVYE